MNILMFSEDPQALVAGSGTQERMREYAEAVGQLHIIVRAQNPRQMQASEGLFLYPVASRSVLGYIRAWRRGAMLCRAHRFDAISVQAPTVFGYIGFYLSRRFHIPLQLQLHTDYMSPHYRQAGWKERAHYHLARFLIPRADCVRAVSRRITNNLYLAKQGTKQGKGKNGCTLLSKVQNKISVLPIFTDALKFLDARLDTATERRFADYDFKMIAVGRFVDKEKNFSMLIDVMRLFVRICPQALLVIVGDGPDRNYYKLQITNYKLEKNIIIEPWRDDLPSFFKSFDLFLLSSNYEGWGRAVIEAMAAGLPVVMTDTGLAGEVVKTQENGIVVPVGDLQAFLDAIKNLYEDPIGRLQIAREGQETSKNLKPQTKKEYLARWRESFVSCRRNGYP